MKHNSPSLRFVLCSHCTVGTQIWFAVVIWHVVVGSNESVKISLTHLSWFSVQSNTNGKYDVCAESLALFHFHRHIWNDLCGTLTLMWPVAASCHLHRLMEPLMLHISWLEKKKLLRTITLLHRKLHRKAQINGIFFFCCKQNNPNIWSVDRNIEQFSSLEDKRKYVTSNIFCSLVCWLLWFKLTYPNHYIKIRVIILSRSYPLPSFLLSVCKQTILHQCSQPLLVSFFSW